MSEQGVNVKGAIKRGTTGKDEERVVALGRCAACSHPEHPFGACTAADPNTLVMCGCTVGVRT